jgi:dCTP deaminase
VILTGPEIHRAWAAEELTIWPFDPELLNPNSYNYHLGEDLLEISDPQAGEKGRRSVCFGPEGHILRPGSLYLCCTEETIGSERYVTTLLGRSSVGRLGLFLNATADLGHCGAISRWTLEMKVVQPLKVYPGMLIGQVCFWMTSGALQSYCGRYHQDSGTEPNRDSTLHKRPPQ